MEGDAGARRLNPTEPDAPRTDDAPDASSAGIATELTEPEAPDADNAAERDLQTPAVDRRPSHLGRGWLAGICAALVLLTAGVVVGGYLALRTNDQSAIIARDDAAAVQAAKECVAATQAPDAAAMSTSQAKIIECATGDFGAQATLFSGVLVDAYQAADVSVAVSELRAAVERHNDDGSIDVLVAVRVKVTNTEVAEQEQGYRLRVRMAPADGTFKIARLDQVAS
jgi:Mce-associated membrane protein